MIELKQNKECARILSEWAKDFQDHDFSIILNAVSEAFESGSNIEPKFLDFIYGIAVENIRGNDFNLFDAEKTIKTEAAHLIKTIVVNEYEVKRQPLFALGSVGCTLALKDVCEQNNETIMMLLRDHQNGHFGEVKNSDIESNINDISESGGVLSVYKIEDETIYIQTLAVNTEQAQTIIMSPSDY